MPLASVTVMVCPAGMFESLSIWPLGQRIFDCVRFVRLAEAESQNQFAGGEIAGTAAEHLRLRLAAAEIFTTAPMPSRFGFCADQF